MRDLMGDHLADLGGIECTSSSERNLIRRGAALNIQAELLEQQFALESSVDAETVVLYGQIVGHIRRLYETLGLQRRARPIGPSLSDLMIEDLDAQRRRDDAAQHRREIEDAVDDVIEERNLVERAPSAEDAS
jgi:hypothetical protein